MLKYIINVIILLFIDMISMNEAALCTDCPNPILGTESENITYGSGNEYNCECDWTIPTSFENDDNYALVLLLQNESLSYTNANIQGCSGAIRFPSTYLNGYVCDYQQKHCTVITTHSTSCGINKIKSQIPDKNHKCDSIIHWRNISRSSYKLQYRSNNLFGYTKYFRIQYLPISCEQTTTAVVSAQISTTQNPTTRPGVTDPIYESNTAKSNTTTVKSHECSQENVNAAIAAVIGIIGGFAIGIAFSYILKRYQTKKKITKKTGQKGTPEARGAAVEQEITFNNRAPTTDDSGYEIPNQNNGKNSHQYEDIYDREYEYE
ncbi:uncharacterized protein LOC120347103 isoform X2 [Styela clava]